MVHINIWSTPRARSSVLTRCLSNIPGSKVQFEKFCWVYKLTQNPEVTAVERGYIDPNYTYENVVKEMQESECEFQIIKEAVLAIRPETYPIIMNKDSVNIFLVRDPALLSTSKLPVDGSAYFDLVTAGSWFTLAGAYQLQLDAIRFVEQNCDKPPLVVPGYRLSTKKGAEQVVREICALIGVEFKEEFLSWKSYGDSFDPTWDVPEAAKQDAKIKGLFNRANNSTGFEDDVERKVSRDQIAKENPVMLQCIREADPIFQQMLKYAKF